MERPDAADCDDQELTSRFQMLKGMQVEGIEWGEDCRGATRQALVEILKPIFDTAI